MAKAKVELQVTDECRHKEDKGYFTILEIIPPKTGINKTASKVAKVEKRLSRGETFGFTKLVPLRLLEKI